jgi:hypothetical protein
MKTFSRFGFALVVLFLCLPLHAQITITMADVSNWYAVGKGEKQLQTSNDTLVYTMNAGVTSATLSQTWTLPTVQYTDTMLIKNVTPSSTLYLNKFPSATHTQMIEITSAGSFVGGYWYFRIANDSVISLGWALRQKAGTVDTTTFDYTSQLIQKLPLAIGSVLPPRRDSSYYGPGNYELSTTTATVDAYGTITLPNGTFSCLRIKETAFYTIYKPGQVDTVTVVRFNWITKEGHWGTVDTWRRDSTSGSIPVHDVKYTANVAVPTVVEQHQIATPTSFALLQNYPNPFNPSTTIRFSVLARSRVHLTVFNLLGQRVAELVNEEMNTGSHERTWNADAASGLYFYRLEAVSVNDPNKRFVDVKKMVLLK